MTPLIKSLVSLTEEASEYIWFDMDYLPRYSINWKNINSVNMPFEKTAICGRDRFGDRFMVLVDQIDDAMMLVAAWALLKTHFTKTPLFAAVIDPAMGGVHIAQVDGEDEITNETAAPIMGVIAEFIQRANPTGYKAVAKNSHINRQRAKKGKAPLIYDWHTVKIDQAKPKSDFLGGTHASPRKHQRRGHWRNHTNGKRVWVRDCWVGDASKGMVFKDYEIRGE